MNKQKSAILAHSSTVIDRLARRRWALAAVGSMALLSMVTSFAFVSSEHEVPVLSRLVLEELSAPSIALLPLENAEFLREDRVQRTDTLISLTARLGISDSAALSFMRQNEEAQLISRQLRPGKIVSAKTDAQGKLLAFYFPLNGKDTTLVVEKTATGFAVREQAPEFEAQVAVKSGEINSSLFAATDAVGIPDAIAIQLAEVFAADIDFYRDLRKGDRFSVVYETQNQHGQIARSGRILSAEFINNDKVYNAYWFATENGTGNYYTSDGASLRKAFLRSPLEFSRVTSGFTTARKHPILQTWRAHKGIDYGAPTGTKVRAVADATVEFAGKQNGYGNLILLKHQGTYSTAYGHLNGFAADLRKGQRVKQGDIIGYVGQTGLASGPHLHYEFRINAQQVNPLSIDLPHAIPLEPAQLAQFKTSIEPLQTKLELAKEINLARAE